MRQVHDVRILDNINDTVRDDLRAEIKRGSRVSVAAACFSMYAYQELKKQLESVETFRFIFTSPTFVKEKAEKQKREFYIPRLSRETSLQTEHESSSESPYRHQPQWPCAHPVLRSRCGPDGRIRADCPHKETLWHVFSGTPGNGHCLLQTQLASQIGRASCREECRSRWSPYH